MSLVATTLDSTIPDDDDISIITEGSLGQCWARGTKKKTFIAGRLSQKAVQTDLGKSIALVKMRNVEESESRIWLELDTWTLQP